MGIAGQKSAPISPQTAGKGGSEGEAHRPHSQPSPTSHCTDDAQGLPTVTPTGIAGPPHKQDDIETAQAATTTKARISAL